MFLVPGYLQKLKCCVSSNRFTFKYTLYKEIYILFPKTKFLVRFYNNSTV